MFAFAAKVKEAHMSERDASVFMNYEEILMAKAAWYYYHEDKTQQQISQIL